MAAGYADGSLHSVGVRRAHVVELYVAGWNDFDSLQLATISRAIVTYCRRRFVTPRRSSTVSEQHLVTVCGLRRS